MKTHCIDKRRRELVDATRWGQLNEPPQLKQCYKGFHPTRSSIEERLVELCSKTGQTGGFDQGLIGQIHMVKPGQTPAKD